MRPSIITISRLHGSGGRQIGALLSGELNIPCYDKQLFYEASWRSNIEAGFFENAEADHKNWIFSYVVNSPLSAPFLPLNERTFIAQCDTIRELAENGPCIIIGRGGNQILKDRDDVLNIFIHAGLETRKKRISKEYGISPEEAEKEIQKVDRDRSIYLRRYTNQIFGKAENYHICINNEDIGIDGAVEIILNLTKS